MFPNAFNIAVYDRDTGGTVTYYYYDGSNPSETTVTLEGLTPGIMYVLSWGVGVSAGWGFDHSGSAELTLDLTDLGDTSPPVPVVIDVAGDTITPNTRSITCNIWPPDGYNVADIVVGSIRLQGTISPASTSVRKGKMLVAKFPTTELGLQAGDVLELKVTGQLGDGASFEGSDSITVVHKGGK